MQNVLRSSLPSGPLPVHCGGFSVLLDCEMLGDSEVLRKLRGQQAEAGSPVRIQDEELFLACCDMTRLPTSPAELRVWLRAADLLCAEPSPELFLAVELRAFRSVLGDARGDEELAALSNVRDFMSALTQRTCLLESFRRVGATARDAGPSEPPLRKTGSRAAAPPELPCGQASQEDALRLIETCEQCGVAVGAFSAKQPSHLWALTRSVFVSVLMGLADRSVNAPEVILQAERLRRLLTEDQWRWLAHRAFVSMWTLERSEQPQLLGGEFVSALQRLYREGTIDLASMVPTLTSSDPPPTPNLCLLPGCLGRLETEKVRCGDDGLRRICIQRLSWLGPFWQLQKCPCYLTGSFLTGVLLPSTRRLVPPGDVDLFVEDVASLQPTLVNLQKSIETMCPGARVTAVKTSDRKFRVTAEHSGEKLSLDLYSHPLRRLSQYHMSAVRAAFDGRRLRCTSTCAVALISSLCIDFDISIKREKTFGILTRKWRSGFSLLLTNRELQSFFKCFTSPLMVTEEVQQHLPTRIRHEWFMRRARHCNLIAHRFQPKSSRWARHCHKHYALWRRGKASLNCAVTRSSEK